MQHIVIHLLKPIVQRPNLVQNAEVTQHALGLKINAPFSQGAQLLQKQQKMNVKLLVIDVLLMEHIALKLMLVAHIRNNFLVFKMLQVACAIGIQLIILA